MHYNVLGLNVSTEDDLGKDYRKLALRYHPDKNKHPQASAVMRMIKEDKEGLEDLLCCKDEMREPEEYLQFQEEACIEDKRIRKAQEGAEERKKKI